MRPWHQAIPNPQDLPAVLDKLLRQVHRHAAHQLLLNLEGLPLLNPELQKLVQLGWLPRLRRSGLRRLALLLPTNPYNRGVIEGFLWLAATEPLPYEVQYFANLAEALDWLTDAELPTAEADWRRSWRTPALLRARQLRWRAEAK
ncbi:hypothetical protein CDA63_07045 [Hymenobacter amundsenii]|uniref:STAS/SEC14 domain-containing protein n=1 Tax=Hymenobacter amundsenii TaxID=2006685 RepID=A0A246FLX8_9BACT|nr:hypothetical protein CDA63_07045 [Hymenobacter amundsenii]